MSDLNREVAQRLLEAADVLEQQGANLFRVRAFRRAAETLARLPRDIGEIVADEGYDGVVALPTIGRGIGAAIIELVATGRWSQLDRLRGTLDPVTLFQTIPGLGRELAQRIHDTLHVDTLEALESAALDGRLERVEGIGTRRAAALRSVLGAMLDQRRRRQPSVGGGTVGPPVNYLLEVDRAYRRKAASGELPTISPRRFNPEGAAWLPILHETRHGWHFTVLYSNTARAHQLGRTRDWVVIYFYDDDHVEAQHTVVTERRGPLKGRRVVRGREPECRDYYDSIVASANGNDNRDESPACSGARCS